MTCLKLPHLFVCLFFRRSFIHYKRKHSNKQIVLFYFNNDDDDDSDDDDDDEVRSCLLRWCSISFSPAYQEMGYGIGQYYHHERTTFIGLNWIMCMNNCNMSTSINNRGNYDLLGFFVQLFLFLFLQ